MLASSTFTLKKVIKVRTPLGERTAMYPALAEPSVHNIPKAHNKPQNRVKPSPKIEKKIKKYKK